MVEPAVNLDLISHAGDYSAALHLVLVYLEMA